jgi:uncharacterized protein
MATEITVRGSYSAFEPPERGTVHATIAYGNNEGKQLPLVHHASVAVEVKFRDFTALSRWVGEHTANTEGFRVSQVEWALTVDRREALLKEVRTRAVRDAVGRAQQYADALGLGEIRCRNARRSAESAGRSEPCLPACRSGGGRC